MHVCVMNRDGTVMHLQDEVVVDDDMRRVAAIGVAAALLVLAVISACEDTVAKLLEPLATARAGAAGIDHAAHGRDVAGLDRFTSEPTAVTRPMISWPGRIG